VLKRVIALRIYRMRLLALVVLGIVAAVSGGGFFDDELLSP
jgi:hypothetical protein